MILAFAGRMGSGKTTLSRKLAPAMDARLLAFGDYVRALMTDQQSSRPGRASLQDLGQKRATADPAFFVKDALRWVRYEGDTNLVVDGIRHLSIWSQIQQQTNPVTPKFLFYIKVDERTRLSRLHRRGLSDAEISEHDLHEVESETELLKQAAIGVLDGNLDSSRLVSEIERFLKIPNIAWK